MKEIASGSMGRAEQFTKTDVASWMAAEIEAKGELYQDDAAEEIERRFGQEFVYENENGNLAISRDVLKEFRKLTETSVVWESREKFWRKREDHDDPDSRRVE